MGAQRAKGKFRTRAGVMTLMLATSPIDRKNLRRILANLVRTARAYETTMKPPTEMDVFWAMIEEDFLLEVADESKLEPDGSIGPDTPMQASPAGKELALVTMSLMQWMTASPKLRRWRFRKVQIDDGAMLALVGGLATTALNHIALRPGSFTEICKLAPTVAQARIEMQLEAAESTGLIEASVWEDGEKRYELTEWGRRAVVPIVAAARFERRHPRNDTLAPDRLDVEMAFCMALPLLTLDRRLEGRCRLAVHLPKSAHEPAGVIADVRDGRVTVLGTDLDAFEEDPSDEARGTLIADADDWMDELVGGDPRESKLEGEGDTELPQAIVNALRSQLFTAIPGP